MFKFADMISEVSKILKRLFDLLERGPVLTGFIIVFAVALAIRLLFVLAWMSLFRVPFSGTEMGSVAINLYEGRGFSSPFSVGSQPTSIFSPAVPIIWSLIMHLTAGPSDDTAHLIIVLQTVPSALAAGCYWLVARRVSSRLGHLPTGMSSLFAILFVVWPESLLRLVDTWYYVWQELGVATLVLSAMAWWDNPQLREGLIMGAAAGGTALVNPNPLPIFAVALFAPLIVRKGERFAIARRAVLAGLFAFLLILPWLVRDAIVFGRFVPIRSGLGLELLKGNNPNGSIRQQTTTIHPLMQKEEFERFERMGETAYMDWASTVAVQYIVNNPIITVVRALERMYVYWCTDILDSWPGIPGTKWWNREWRIRILEVTTILSALVPLAIVLFGIISGRLRGLAYRFLFMALFILLPLPYYFTTAENVYSQSTRPWLAMLAAIVVFRRPRRADESTAEYERSTLAAV